MTNFKTIFFVIAIIFTTSIFGQAKTEVEEKPYIEVIGAAEKEIVPDEIFIKIFIQEKSIDKEKLTIEVQEEKLKAALKEIGVNLSNLSLTDANADYIKVSWVRKGVVAKKEYMLKVSNATTVGQVFQQLDKLEITGAYISRVDHSKIDSLKKEVRILAMKAAKEKADYLLKTIGEQTGKPLVIQERDYNTIIQTGGLNVKGSRSESTSYYVDGVKVKQDKDIYEIQFQKIKIQSGIYVKFAIK